MCFCPVKRKSRLKPAGIAQFFETRRGARITRLRLKRYGGQAQMARIEKLRYEQQVVRSPNRFSRAIVSFQASVLSDTDENLGSLRKFTPLCFVRQSRDLWSACVLASLFGEAGPWLKSDAKDAALGNPWFDS